MIKAEKLGLKNETSKDVAAPPEHANATVTGDADERRSREHEGPLITDIVGNKLQSIWKTILLVLLDRQASHNRMVKEMAIGT